MKPVLILICAAASAATQDARRVVEPAIPAACATLTAAVFDESRLDTKRIQQAMDRCAPGKAVVPASSG
jgi:polygalacturonase